MRSHSLELRVLLLIATVVAIGFGILTFLNVKRHRDDLLAEARQRREVTATSLVEGIRSIMRTGDVLRVRELVTNIRSLPAIAKLRIYNSDGREAYQLPAERRARKAVDQTVASVLATAQATTIEEPEGGTISAVVPLPNGLSCHRCHGSEDELRGVFSVTLTSMQPNPDEAFATAVRTVSMVISFAYESLMVTEHRNEIADVVSSIGLASGISKIEIYGVTGEQVMGLSQDIEVKPLTEEEMALMDEDREVFRRERGMVELLRPIMSRSECARCHVLEEGRLGVIRVALSAPGDSEPGSKPWREKVAGTVIDAITEALVGLLEMGGAAPVRYYVHRLAAIPGIVNFGIFDNQGKPALSDELQAAAVVREVLATGTPREMKESIGRRALLTLFRPIMNNKECRTCHGGEHGVRAIVAVSVSADEIRRRIEKSTKYSVLAGLAMLVLAGILLVAFFEMAIVRRIKRIGEVADNVGAGDLNLRADDSKDDELGRLAQRLNAMIDGLIDKQRIEESLRIARDIHLSRLPKKLPVLAGLEIGGRTLPCEETGGDYYDFVTLQGDEQHRLGVIIADVASHGIGPALIMSETRAFIKATMLTVREIPTALKVVNSLLYGDLKEGRFVTLFLGEIDPHARTLTYASAGHHPGMIYRARSKRFESLESTSVPLGIRPKADFPLGPVLKLEEGDMIILLTDGVTETPNAQRERFGRHRLKRVLRQNMSKSAQEMASTVIDAVLEFKGGAEQPDDLTAAVIKVVPLPVETIPKDSEARLTRLQAQRFHRSG